MQNNGSVYLHAVLSLAGMPILPSEQGFDAGKVYVYTKCERRTVCSVHVGGPTCTCKPPCNPHS